MSLNVLLLVYSGTGNTLYLAHRFEAELTRLGHRVTLHQIDRLPPDWVLPAADLVGLGEPVYHTAPPAHVLRQGVGVPRSKAAGDLRVRFEESRFPSPDHGYERRDMHSAVRSRFRRASHGRCRQLEHALGKGDRQETASLLNDGGDNPDIPVR